MDIVDLFFIRMLYEENVLKKCRIFLRYKKSKYSLSGYILEYFFIFYGGDTSGEKSIECLKVLKLGLKWEVHILENHIY
jgi:hypothetical protein